MVGSPRNFTFTDQDCEAMMACRHCPRTWNDVLLRQARGLCFVWACGLLLLSGCRSFCPRSLTKDVVDARQASLAGMDAMQQGRWDEAENIFASAVQACPVDERARGCYAETLWRRGACEQAVANMQQAVRLSSGDPQRLVQLGEMHLALGQLNEAVDCARQATAKSCNHSAAWALQGDVYVARGQLDEALAAYHRSISHHAHQPRVQMAMARIYLRQERTQRALSTLETLAEQYPPQEIPADVYAARGVCLKQLDRPYDALEMFAQAAAKGELPPDALVQYAETQSQSGDQAGAIATLDAALQRQPDHAAALQLRSELASRQNTLTAQVGDRLMR